MFCFKILLHSTFPFLYYFIWFFWYFSFTKYLGAPVSIDISRNVADNRLESYRSCVVLFSMTIRSRIIGSLVIKLTPGFANRYPNKLSYDNFGLKFSPHIKSIVTHFTEISPLWHKTLDLTCKHIWSYIAVLLYWKMYWYFNFAFSNFNCYC